MRVCFSAYPQHQTPKEQGKGRINERKGIRKITGPTLWNYDSMSLILELKPLCTAFDRAICSFIHTRRHTHIPFHTHKETYTTISMGRAELNPDTCPVRNWIRTLGRWSVWNWIRTLIRGTWFSCEGGSQGNIHSLRLGVISCSPHMMTRQSNSSVNIPICILAIPIRSNFLAGIEPGMLGPDPAL